jgi:hypothetical protein
LIVIKFLPKCGRSSPDVRRFPALGVILSQAVLVAFMCRCGTQFFAVHPKLAFAQND